MTWFLESGGLRFSSDDQRRDGRTYYGDLSRQQAIRFTRSLRFWPHGNSGGSLATGVIRLDNGDGRYDDLLRTDMRDQPIRVWRVGADGQEYTALTGIIDGVSAPNDQVVDFQLRDTLSRLDKPLQSRSYGAEADEGIEGRTLPVTLGIARNIRPTMWEAYPAATGPAYRVHDAPVAGITNVRDKGVPLAGTQFALDNRIGRAGFTLGTEPVGVVTVDVSSSGAGSVDAGAPDPLGGNGEFDTEAVEVVGAGAFPFHPGWDYFAAGTGTLSAECPPPRHYYHFWYPDRFPQREGVRLLAGLDDAGGRVILTTSAKICQANKGYRVEVGFGDIGEDRLRGFSEEEGAILSDSEVIIRATPTVETGASRDVGAEIIRVAPYRDGEGVLTASFAPSVDCYLQVALFNGIGNIRHVRVFEESQTNTTVLPGITLREMVAEAFSRVGEGIDRINDIDLDQISGQTAEIGYYTADAVTALSVIRTVLGSYTSDLFTDRQGNIRFAQLRNPAAEVADHKIDASRLVGPPSIRVDDAPGLTNRAWARRNYYQFRDGEFADNPQDIPLDTRERFKNPAQFIRRAVTPPGFPSLYTHALEAEPLRTLFDSGVDAALEIQRVMNLYVEPRLFVEIEVLLEAHEYVELNEVVELRYPRYGLDEGVRFLVTSVTDEVSGEARQRKARLELWGSTNRVFEFNPPVRPDPVEPRPDEGGPLEPRGQVVATESAIPLATEDARMLEVDAELRYPPLPLAQESGFALLTEDGKTITTE